MTSLNTWFYKHRDLTHYQHKIVPEPVPFEDNSLLLLPPPPPPPSLLFSSSISNTNAVLNEQDQKTFTSFLDAFSMDKNITLPSIDQQQEEQRRHSILQALDEQKRSYQHKRTPIYLRHSVEPSYTLLKKRPAQEDTNTRKKKLLLTKEEKRQNHLASEQKRRSNIRHGFKGLIELVPSLQKISNSKSTVLTKAAEFIQHLEKRNTYLTEKLNTLQWRVAQLPPLSEQRRTSNSSGSSSSSSSSNSMQSDPMKLLPYPAKKPVLFDHKLWLVKKEHLE